MQRMKSPTFILSVVTMSSTEVMSQVTLRPTTVPAQRTTDQVIIPATQIRPTSLASSRHAARPRQDPIKSGIMGNVIVTSGSGSVTGKNDSP
jgi:hypothetical protein